MTGASEKSEPLVLLDDPIAADPARVGGKRHRWLELAPRDCRHFPASSSRCGPTWPRLLLTRPGYLLCSGSTSATAR